MESKKSFSLKTLKEDLKKLLKRYKEINDIYLFGSFVKGKFRPADIDIAVITDKKDFELLKRVIKELDKYPKLHIEMFMFSEIFTEPIWKSLLSEGFSIKKNKYLRELMDIDSGVLYNYDLRKLNHSEKTMFNRAFKEEIKITNSDHISAGTAITPIGQEKEFDDFLSRWEKAKVKKKRILIL